MLTDTFGNSAATAAVADSGVDIVVLKTLVQLQYAFTSRSKHRK